jgi:lysozyme family protein
MAFRLVLGQEGETSNYPEDPGGRTKFGISRGSYPQLDIDALTVQEAKEILHRDFWNRGCCEEISEINGGERVAIKLFSIAVNVGVAAAARILQRAVRANGFRVDDDGICGPKTMEALQKCLWRGGKDALLTAMRSEAAGYYRSLPLKLKEKFLKGWLERAYS